MTLIETLTMYSSSAKVGLRYYDYLIGPETRYLAVLSFCTIYKYMPLDYIKVNVFHLKPVCVKACRGSNYE